MSNKIRRVLWVIHLIQKNKYQAINQQFQQMAKLINQLSQLYMIMESDVGEMKIALRKEGILKEPEDVNINKADEVSETNEPEKAKESDYFPGKSENSEDSL